MFIIDYFRKWFERKPDSNSTNVDPLAAAALTTDTSADKPPVRDNDENAPKNTTFDDGYDATDSDFDID